MVGGLACSEESHVLLRERVTFTRPWTGAEFSPTIWYERDIFLSDLDLVRANQVRIAATQFRSIERAGTARFGKPRID